MALRWAVVAGITACAAVGGASSPSTVRVAALAYELRDASVESRGELEALIELAAREGASFVSTPEPAPSADRSCASAEGIPGPSTAFFSGLATRLGIWIGFSLFERAPAGCFAAALLAGPDGEIHQKIRKVLVDQATNGGLVAGAFRDVVDSVDADGVRAAVLFADDLVAGVPRLAGRGAEVVLVHGGGGLEPGALARAAEENAIAIAASATTCGEESCAAGVYGARATRHVHRHGTVFLAEVTLPRRWVIASALGLPATVPIPATGPANDALAELGRQLFTDTRLSSTGSVACITCHQPQRAFTNGQPRGVGVADRVTKRNVPSLLNVAYKPVLQWDGYASSIENFVKYPLSNPSEMDFHYLDKVVPYVRSRPDYVAAFRASMAVETIEFEDIATALAAYQRTLVSGNSPFDRHMFGGDRRALSVAAVRGLEIFRGRGCAGCHVIARRHALFTDYGYHNLGIGYDRAAGRYRDIGLGGISTNDSSGLFLTPSLRNVALTAPYMHDGSLPTLAAVLEFYNRGTVDAPHVTPLAPLHLDTAGRRDLIAFLESLTGDQRYDAGGRRLAQ